MITLQLARRRDGQHFDQGSRQESIRGAMAVLIQSELAFGADVTDVSATRLALETRVFGCIDSTVFEGSAEEMAPLLQAVALVLEADSHEDLVFANIMAQLERIPTGFVPRTLDMVAPLVLGRARLAVAFMIPMGITDPQDLELGAGLPLGDLVAAFELASETGLSFRTVVETVR